MATRHENLSERECEVLRCLIRLGRMKAVAREMNLHSRTVETHIKSARQKLGLATTLHVVVHFDRLERATA